MTDDFDTDVCVCHAVDKREAGVCVCVCRNYLADENVCSAYDTEYTGVIWLLTKAGISYVTQSIRCVYVVVNNSEAGACTCGSVSNIRA